MRDALDFETAPSPLLLASLGLDALVYTGNARPTQAWVDQARSVGVTVTFVQETVSTRSQQGFQAGVYDCQFAEARAKELGHTGSIAYVVSDGSWSDVWDASDYGRGVQSVATLPFFCYGAVPICESFNRGAPASLGTWVPETWGTGTLLTQVVGSSPVAGTDLNHVHADYTGSVPAPAPAPKETPSMFIGLVNRNDPSVPNACDAHLVDGGVVIRTFTGAYTPWGFVVTQQDAQDFAAAAGIHPMVLTPDEWSRINTRTTATLGASPGATHFTGTVSLQAA